MISRGHKVRSVHISRMAPRQRVRAPRRSGRGYRRGARTDRRSGTQHSTHSRHRRGWAPAGVDRSFSAAPLPVSSFHTLPACPGAVCQRGRCSREESHAVAFDPRDQVVAVGQQAANDLAAGIVGVGHEVDTAPPFPTSRSARSSCPAGFAVAVGIHRTFVDATGQGQGEYSWPRLE